MPDAHRFELIDGALMERHSSYFSSQVAARIMNAIGAFVDHHKLGYYAGESGGLRCFQDVFPEDPERVLIPDGSFVSYGRLPGGPLETGWLHVAPEFVLEVISPNDVAEDLNTKVTWYFAAGVRSVWVASPATRTIWVRHPDRQDRTFGAGDTVEDSVVFPGFSVPLEDLFPPA